MAAVYAGVLLCLLVLHPGSAAQGAASDPKIFDEPPARIDVIAKVVKNLDSRYQIELPNAGSLTAESDRELVRREGTRAILPGIIVKIMMVIGAVIILVMIFNLFFGAGRFDAVSDDDLLDEQGDIDFTKLQMPDPEELAASGRFAEAIHAVLLRSLVLISRRIDAAWPRSLTSREILRHGKLPVTARGHLRQLIQRVEIHHFGGLEPAANDYSRCQEIYEKLRVELRGRPS